MSTYYIAGYPVSDELYHYGILGMKWGVRRFQNEDGSYTPEGKKRYGLLGGIGSLFKRSDKRKRKDSWTSCCWIYDRCYYRYACYSTCLRCVRHAARFAKPKEKLTVINYANIF